MMSYLDDLYPDRIIIEDDVIISYRTTFACHGSVVRYGRIVLHRRCYIGMSSTIVVPVEIGEGAVVGAGAVVIKDIPESARVAGVPAKILEQNPHSNDFSSRKTEIPVNPTPYVIESPHGRRS